MSKLVFSTDPRFARVITEIKDVDSRLKRPRITNNKSHKLSSYEKGVESCINKWRSKYV